MDDDRIWSFERKLWTADADFYREKISDDAQFVVPSEPFAMSGKQAAAAMSGTPRWDQVHFTDKQVSRPQEGMIVIAYKAEASRSDECYKAWCTSTYRRLSHEDWEVVQHQQTLEPVAVAQA